MRTRYVANIFNCRNYLLTFTEPQRGVIADVKPYAGLDYDAVMWIDSDMVFAHDDFSRLMEDDKDIVAGIAKTDEAGTLNCGIYDASGEDVPYTTDTIPDELFEVDYAGLAWCLVKRSVLESMSFPWFRQLPRKVGKKVFFPGEDQSWCWSAKQLGYEIWVDPQVKIGHEKSAVWNI